MNATRVERQFVNGEGFLYLGRSYRLKLVPKQDEPLLLKDGYFCLRAICEPAARARSRLPGFLSGQRAGADQRRVAYFKATHGC